MSTLGIALQDSNGARGYAGPPQVSEPDDVMERRVAQLTPGQLACLRMVNDHLNSKEIAAQLDISPHTVDQRIRGALHILGVERRSQAARIVARFGGEYQRLIHQSPHIERQLHPGHPEAAIGYQIRHADRAGEAEGAGFRTEQRAVAFAPSLQLPFATRRNPRNEMNVGQRLFWIAMIAIGAAFSAGMYLAGLESLARLLSR
jgi:DNA-binding CsgD family transcriptional regulator